MRPHTARPAGCSSPACARPPTPPASRRSSPPPRIWVATGTCGSGCAPPARARTRGLMARPSTRRTPTGGRAPPPRTTRAVSSSPPPSTPGAASTAAWAPAISCARRCRRRPHHPHFPRRPRHRPRLSQPPGRPLARRRRHRWRLASGPSSSLPRSSVASSWWLLPFWPQCSSAAGCRAQERRHSRRTSLHPIARH